MLINLGIGSCAGITIMATIGRKNATVIKTAEDLKMIEIY